MSAAPLGRARSPHVIIDGAYQVRLTELGLKASDAMRDPTRRARLGSPAKSEAEEAAEEYDALLEEAKRTYVLQAVGNRRWRDAKEAHPARKVGEGDDATTHPDDAPTGVNVTTFFMDVLVESIIDPDTDEYDPRPLFTTKQADDFVDTLSDADWRALCGDIWALNERGSGIPTSSMTSLLRRLIDEDSKQQSDSESASPVSTGRSRLSATSSTTQPDDGAPKQKRSRLSSAATPSGTSSSGT